MSYISESYMRTRDIDWFAVVNGLPCHFASNGGLLPSELIDRETLVWMQQFAAQLEDIPDVEIEVNQEYIARRLSKEQQMNIDGEKAQLYLRSFEEYAKKGFVSYDRQNPEDPNCNQYMWITRPHEGDYLHSYQRKLIAFMDSSIEFQCDNNGAVEFL